MHLNLGLGLQKKMAVAAPVGPADPYFDNVQFLMQPRVTDTLISHFVDRSNNAAGAGSVFGTAVFDGAELWNGRPSVQLNNGRLEWGANSNFVPTAGQHWTLELRVDADASTQGDPLFNLMESTAGNHCLRVMHNGNNIDLEYSSDGSNWVVWNCNITNTTTKAEIAFSYDGTYLNNWELTGLYHTRINVGAGLTLFQGTPKLTIGDDPGGGGHWDGNNFGVRWTVGTSRHTTAVGYTPDDLWPEYGP